MAVYSRSTNIGSTSCLGQSGKHSNDAQTIKSQLLYYSLRATQKSYLLAIPSPDLDSTGPRKFPVILQISQNEIHENRLVAFCLISGYCSDKLGTVATPWQIGTVSSQKIEPRAMNFRKKSWGKPQEERVMQAGEIRSLLLRPAVAASRCRCPGRHAQ